MKSNRVSFLTISRIAINIIMTVGVAGLTGGQLAAAQEASSTDLGFGCFDNLSAPEFPKAALAGNIDGTVYAVVHVSPSGTVEKIEKNTASADKDGAKVLEPAVDAAIRAAKIRPQCVGKTVSVVFRYSVYSSDAPDAKVASKTAGNIMYIEGASARGKG